MKQESIRVKFAKNISCLKMVFFVTRNYYILKVSTIVVSTVKENFPENTIQ